MKTSGDIRWLAGLLEGEAAFMWTNGTPSIALQMSDSDVVHRVATLFGVTLRKPWTPKAKAGYKTIHGCRIYGAQAIGWMMSIYSEMGVRRRTKIRQIIALWKAARNFPRAPRGERWMAMCHPDRPRTGGGLCGTCYMREWRGRSRNNHFRAKAAQA